MFVKRIKSCQAVGETFGKVDQMLAKFFSKRLSKFVRTFWVSSGSKLHKACRSRKILQNELFTSIYFPKSESIQPETNYTLQCWCLESFFTAQQRRVGEETVQCFCASSFCCAEENFIVKLSMLSVIFSLQRILDLIWSDYSVVMIWGEREFPLASQKRGDIRKSKSNESFEDVHAMTDLPGLHAF